EPELAARIWRLNDLFGVIPAHSAERLSVIALANLDKIRARSKALLETNRKAVNAFLDSCEGLRTARGEWGTILFPRLIRGSVDELCALLRDKYETSVAPGRFFELPEHFRLGMGGDPEMVATGLDRLAQAVAEIARTH